jgi:hypothetical protein
MIISRKFMVEDIGGIDDIYQKQGEFGVPSLENVVINSTLVDSVTGRIVGYGAVKIFAEAILLLDKELGKKEKARAIREAMKTAIVYSKDAGIEYLYMITKSESFSKVLRQNYLAERVPGETLMINLGSDKEMES